MYWVGAETSLVGFLAQLTALAKSIRKHYHGANKPAPRYIDLYAPDGSVIRRVEVESEDQ